MADLSSACSGLAQLHCARVCVAAPSDISSDATGTLYIAQGVDRQRLRLQLLHTRAHVPPSVQDTDIQVLCGARTTWHARACLYMKRSQKVQAMPKATPVAAPPAARRKKRRKESPAVWVSPSAQFCHTRQA